MTLTTGAVLRENLRFKRKQLDGRRIHLMRRARQEAEQNGQIAGATSRKLRHTEREIHLFNEFAPEAGLPPIPEPDLEALTSGA